MSITDSPVQTPQKYAALPKGIQILVVEDSPLQAKVFLKLLKELGYRNVVHVEEPEKVLDTAREQATKIIICDWNMPTMSGLDVLQQVRADETLKSIPFIFLTANADRDKVIEAAKNGANDYIVKPAVASVIEEKLRKAGGVAISRS